MQGLGEPLQENTAMVSLYYRLQYVTQWLSSLNNIKWRKTEIMRKRYMLRVSTTKEIFNRHKIKEICSK